MQLIVIQTFSEVDLFKSEDFLEALKEKKYLSSHARIINTEHYIYEQCHSNNGNIQEMGQIAGSIFEVMDTWNFSRLTNYIDKWKRVLKPYEEALDSKNN